MAGVCRVAMGCGLVKYVKSVDDETRQQRGRPSHRMMQREARRNPLRMAGRP